MSEQTDLFAEPSRAEPMRPPDFGRAVAYQKIGKPLGWSLASWEALDGDDRSAIFSFAPFQIGPRGKKKWGRERKRAVVSMAEINQAAQEYEEQSGNCRDCAGSAQEWAGWDHIKGNQWRACHRCGATRKPRA